MPSSLCEFFHSYREPAYCLSHGFVTPPFLGGVTGTEASPLMGSVVTGPYREIILGRGLPTALPAVYRLALREAAGVGFAVMSGIITWDRSHAGQLFTRQGISL